MITDWPYLITGGIFLITYLGLALGRIPGLRTDRAGIAFVGAAALLAAGQISLSDAATAVDFSTILLLLGMMILVGGLQIARFFNGVTDFIASRVNSPYLLLGLVMLLSGGLSALMVNDVVCVALTPLVLSLCLLTGRPPTPYLIALATASNIGSVATITGNPQNMIIGSLSGISYLYFAWRLAPVALMGLALNYLVVCVVYRRQLAVMPARGELFHGTGVAPLAVEQEQASSGPRGHARMSAKHRSLMWRGLIVMLITAGLFFAGANLAITAACAGGLMLLTGVRAEKFYRRVDWPLLVMFAGLFIVVHAFEANVVHHWRVGRLVEGVSSPLWTLTGISVVLSNLVSNVPAVLLFRTIIPGLPDPTEGWLVLAMSSTLAGNLTILGSVANLIVVESARRQGVRISFLEYLKVGVVVTFLTTLVGAAWLILT